MRIVLVTLICLLDMFLKFALGFLVVYVIWRPFNIRIGAEFGPGWALAAAFLGVCINGFFEGCDIILLGWAKRVAGAEPPDREAS